ncbi:5 5 P-1 P-4-tetraphosphate phosphorylase 2 [Fusarium pseudoanthophilum]|uniref:5 5 P-1 P-4-tetraphosphate phosphorylase 2 n=1 Tax=Fusarium pseudoanthophilum TaxID=48495 RepID=A0A8H5KHS3_9HYPO|nr:5 5 P-1 P-4-tetraphosphate phosphorylase 2 [Fusarium pseudoanthophilum]
MPRIKAPSNLPELVKSTFTKARSDGDLHYFPTQVAILNVDSIPFQLRFSPSLANKPKAPPKDLTKPQKPFDPFEKPSPALKVTDLGPSHYLVLNKFAVVPEHFILATTEFKPQTHVLEESDLEATLACIEAYEAARRTQAEQGHRYGTLGGGDGLFAFFNCGDHSGASQPHRHIQLLPIARMKDGFEADTPWSVLADQLKTKMAPFATFAEDIKLGMSGADLHSTYLRLYRKACRAVALYTKDPLHTEEAPAEGPTRISYNMAMTKDTLVVCPRLAEGVKLQSQDGDVLGTVALNGTLLAGTALVKNELEWEALKKDPETLRNILRDIGFSTSPQPTDPHGLRRALSASAVSYLDSKQHLSKGPPKTRSLSIWASHPQSPSAGGPGKPGLHLHIIVAVADTAENARADAPAATWNPSEAPRAMVAPRADMPDWTNHSRLWDSHRLDSDGDWTDHSRRSDSHRVNSGGDYPDFRAPTE